ncbi:MAG: ABC transporter substrate-binding protein [Stellaceae bacterium]
MTTTRNGTTRRWLGAAAIAALGWAATLSGANAAGVDLGMFTSLTGASAVVGQDMQRGAQLAVDQINAGYAVPMKDGSTVKLGPGLLGGPVTLSVEDSQSDPKAAMDAVRKLVEVDKVPVVLGEYSSGLTLPTGQYTNKNKIVQISIGANSPMLRDIGPYFFDMIALNNVEGPPMVDIAVRDLKAKTFATMVPNNPYGVGLEQALCDAAKTSGGSCAVSVRYESNQTDYRAQLQQIAGANPDAVFFFAYGSDATLLLKQASELGMTPGKNWFGPEMSNWSNEVTANPDIAKIADGIRGIDFSVGGNFYDKTYAAPFKAKFGADPATDFGGFAYDATMVAALAINAANSADPTAIQKQVINMANKYKGVTGDKSMDKDGMQVNATLVDEIYKDGKLQPYTPGSGG